MIIDTKSRSSSLLRRLRRLGNSERKDEAKAFIRRFYRENNFSKQACQKRQAEVDRQLRQTGSYEHTSEELAFGARIAWRNHARCIGRLFWTSLEVRDCRHVTDVDDMVIQIMDHMESALGDGRIKSIISIFPPVKGNVLPAYVESSQVIRYAGYVDKKGNYLGDRANIELTRIAISLGWPQPETPSMFDILPLVVRSEKGYRLIYEIRKSAIREVKITHPDYSGINELNLRWYAVPCISGMILTIGGLDYPCAPFNGYYMGTEIASRNFTDINRYNFLPAVAKAIGEDVNAKGIPLWKDRALTELNKAILHSFQGAGVTIVDHHTASEQYIDFAGRERAAGRIPSGNWTWIVPPQAASACPVFHLPMQDVHTVPNYYYSRLTDGRMLTPDYQDEYRHRLQIRLDRFKRRYQHWRRRYD